MRKMYELYHHCFEIVPTGTKEAASIISKCICNGLSLDSCYDRPSQTKIEIYGKWMEWFRLIGGVDFTHTGVSSYNAQIFTLQGVRHTQDGHTEYFYITPSYNKVVMV